MTRVPCCKAHYGGRPIKIYRGPIYQKGGGFFGDVFKHLIPLFTTQFLPYVGKKLFKQGEEFAESVKQGTPLRTALKQSARKTLKEGREDVLRKLQGGGAKKKRSLKRRTVKKRVKKNKKRRLPYDYFS
jgi:hypothetical protein